MSEGTPEISAVRPHRRGLIRADRVTLGALIALVLIAFVVELFVVVSDPAAVWIVAVVFAIVPAALWLSVFYREDLVELEPRRMVVGVFALSALLAIAVGEPLIGAFDTDEWLGTNVLVHLLGGFAIVGMIQAFLQYLSIRFTVYESAEFDQPPDGTIYGTAAGLGYGIVLNATYIFGSGTVDLGLAALHVVFTALAHAAFGGVMGYFVGRQRLERRPVWWSAAGVALAALLSSLLYAIRAALVAGNETIGGIVLGPWLGLLVAVLLSVGVSAVLIRSLRRDPAWVEPRATS